MVVPYPRSFYAQNARQVARHLLGAQLVHQTPQGRLSGMIVEAEAYTGLDDKASHSHRGKSPRNLPMWEAPGHAYAYLIYGRYWLLNAVCEPAEQPAAVLIRAIEPLEGLEQMSQARPGVHRNGWTNGPGRLTLALGITGQHNRRDLCDPATGLWIEPYRTFEDSQVVIGPRVGMGQVPEPWFSLPLRWAVQGHPDVSRPKPK
jgi:DNA-3-methyladenine glycosylase